MLYKKNEGVTQLKVINVLRENEGIWISSPALWRIARLPERRFREVIKSLMKNDFVVWRDNYPGARNKKIKYWRLKEDYEKNGDV